MTLFKFIRESLANIGFKANYKPQNTITAIPDTVKEVDHKKQVEAVRKAFAQQEQEMRIRAMKIHSSSCEDNWTCRKEPCYIPEPDKIVKHKKSCVHFYGIIMSEPLCDCGKSKDRRKDKDFLHPALR
jgi:hypothetical protein